MCSRAQCNATIKIELCIASKLLFFRVHCLFKVHEPRDDDGNVVEHDPIQLQVDKMERLLTVADTKPVSG